MAQPNPLTDNERRLVAAYASVMKERDAMKLRLQAKSALVAELRAALETIAREGRDNHPRWSAARAGETAQLALGKIAIHLTRYREIVYQETGHQETGSQ